jgi:hypothetical protein
MKPTDKNNKNEPFDPRNTPQPPQAKHPTSQEERSDNSSGPKTDTNNKKPVDTGKRLGDETEITDETTI